MFVQEKIDTDLGQEAKLLTLEEFWDWYPDGYQGRFELHNGVIVKMQPTRTHEQVAVFFASKLSVYIDRFNMVQPVPLTSLYEYDYPAWLDLTLAQLKRKEFSIIDWANLIEEIEELGREQRHKVESYVLRLLIHLLLYEYWQTERPWSGKGWEKEIDNFRLELDSLLESQVLHNHFLATLPKEYAKARKLAIKKSHLSPTTFPEVCPYTLDQILDFGWLPAQK